MVLEVFKNDMRNVINRKDIYKARHSSFSFEEMIEACFKENSGSTDNIEIYFDGILFLGIFNTSSLINYAIASTTDFSNQLISFISKFTDIVWLLVIKSAMAKYPCEWVEIWLLKSFILPISFLVHDANFSGLNFQRSILTKFLTFPSLICKKYTKYF